MEAEAEEAGLSHEGDLGEIMRRTRLAALLVTIFVVAGVVAAFAGAANAAQGYWVTACQNGTNNCAPLRGEGPYPSFDACWERAKWLIFHNAVPRGYYLACRFYRG